MTSDVGGAGDGGGISPPSVVKIPELLLRVIKLSTRGHCRNNAIHIQGIHKDNNPRTRIRWKAARPPTGHGNNGEFLGVGKWPDMNWGGSQLSSPSPWLEPMSIILLLHYFPVCPRIIFFTPNKQHIPQRLPHTHSASDRNWHGLGVSFVYPSRIVICHFHGPPSDRPTDRPLCTSVKVETWRSSREVWMQIMAQNGSVFLSPPVGTPRRRRRTQLLGK